LSLQYLEKLGKKESLEDVRGGKKETPERSRDGRLLEKKNRELVAICRENGEEGDLYVALPKRRKTVRTVQGDWDGSPRRQRKKG